MPVIEIDAFLVQGMRLIESNNGHEQGSLYVYIIRNRNGLYALIEDLFVFPEYRRCGVATRLHARALTIAENADCYKMVALSRNDGTRTAVQEWYQRLGYTCYGSEFRRTL